MTRSRRAGTSGTRWAAATTSHDYAPGAPSRAAGHYEWSFEAARFPSPDGAAVYAGLAADPAAGQEFLDTFARRHRPDEVLTPARRARWRAAWAYEKGLDELRALLEGLDDDAMGDRGARLPGLERRRPPRPPRRRRRGRRRAGPTSPAPWRPGGSRRSPRRGTRGPTSTCAGSPDRSRDALLCGLHVHGGRVVQALRRGDGPLAAGPGLDGRRRRSPTSPCTWPTCGRRWGSARTPAARPPGSGSAPTGTGCTSASWRRTSPASGSPTAAGVAGRRGDPAGTVTARRYELFRMITGRRSAAEIRRYDWTTDPTPYLDVISPYPLPD